ncbi:MAG TPA: hypothetical protein VGL63_16530 [Streptosporangiaceae bacterium]
MSRGAAACRNARAASRGGLGRLLATPTFVAGLATVVVAVMAYGTTQTHLLFSGEPACATASCSGAGSHAAGGALLQISARPDVGTGGSAGRGGTSHSPRRGTVAGVIAGPQPDPEPVRQTSAGGASPSPPSGRAPWAPVAVTYQTLRTSRGGFQAAITITSRSRSVIRGWRLWLHYPSASVGRMQGARWLPAGPRRDAGLAASHPGQELRPGASIRIVLWADGTAGAPVGCLFDGGRCSYAGRS